MPLDEMTIAGIFELVSSFDSAGRRDRPEALGAERAELPFLARVLAAPVRVLVRRGAERRLLVVLFRLHLGVELAQALGVARQRLDRHRAVDEHRQHRDAAFFFEPLQPVQQLLDPAHGERRDDHAAAAPDGLLDDPLEHRAVVVRVVHAIAVGRFDQQVVRFVDHRRIRQHRTIEAAEIAAEEHRLAVDVDPRVRGAEQVAGVDELDLDALGDGHRTVVADRLQQRERAHGVGLAVERQRRRVLRVAVAVGVRGVLFLDAARIGQHDAGRGPGCRRCRRRVRGNRRRRGAAGSRRDRGARA